LLAASQESAAKASREWAADEEELSPTKVSHKAFSQRLPLVNCERFTSSNFDSGHFELHFVNRSSSTVADRRRLVELRVQSKTRAELAELEKTLQALHGMGLLGPNNDGRVHPEAPEERERRFIGMS
jgi:hypothetical protein